MDIQEQAAKFQLNNKGENTEAERNTHYQLHETGFLRIDQIVGSARKHLPPLIPVSKSTWWAGVKSGRFPRSKKLSARVTVWSTTDIRDYISRVSEQKD